MHCEYRQLIADTRQLLEEEWPSGQILLTAHTFLAPALKEESAALSLSERRPGPLPPSPAQAERPAPRLPPARDAVVARERRPLPSPQPFSKEIQKLFLQHAPHIPLAKTAAAQEKREADQEIRPVVLLHFGGSTEEETFMKNLCKAIDTRLSAAQLLDGAQLEREERWSSLLAHSTLRWIVSPPQARELPGIRAHYQEAPGTGEQRLGNTPLFLLSPIAAYLHNPDMKRALWQKLSSLL